MASIRKRKWVTTKGEKQEAWVLDYVDQHGERHIKTYKRRTDADKERKTVEHQVDEGTHTADSSSVTVADAAEEWIKGRRADGVERSTLAQYRQHIDYHINPGLGTVKLSRLRTPHVERYKDWLLETRSRAMAQKALQSLRSLLTDAQRRGLVSQNVARGVTIKTRGREKEHVEIPSQEEIRLILGEASDPWRPLFVTAILTGLRASELRGLSWDQVDLKRKVLQVSQRADRWHRIGAPKSRTSRREVPLAPMVVNTLREWKAKCPKGDLRLVFPARDGRIHNHANLYRNFASLQRRCKITIDTGKKDRAGKPILRAKYGPHALRHFFASWAIDQDFPPKKVQALLGHASIQMTFDTYGHLFPSPEDDQAKFAAGEIALVAG